VWGRVPQRLVEPCELGDLWLFALGLFESGRVGVGGGDGGEVLLVHALSRGPRFPDPTVGSNGLPTWGPIITQSPAEQAAQQAAQPVCKKDLPSLGLHTSAEKATANAAALKYATCMRSNGVPNFPDPNGQGVLLIQGGNIEASSPAFQKAQTACKRLDNGFGEQSSVASGSSASGGGGGSGS